MIPHLLLCQVSPNYAAPDVWPFIGRLGDPLTIWDNETSPQNVDGAAIHVVDGHVRILLTTHDGGGGVE